MIFRVTEFFSKEDLCKEYQTLVTRFTYHALIIKSYSASFKNDFPNAIVNFLGFKEHIEKIPLERADAGRLMHYMEYLKKNLVEGAEALSVIEKCCAHL